MTKQEAKEYIKKTWNISSGKRITKMVKKYWDLKEKDIVEVAKEIFNAKQKLK